MPILKKTLAIILILSVPYNIKTYDAYYCEYEVTQVLNFIQILEQNYPQNYALIQYLEEQIYDTSNKISNDDIAKIATIVANRNLTTHKKIKMLTMLINQPPYKQHGNLGEALGFFFFFFILPVGLLNEIHNQIEAQTQLHQTKIIINATITPIITPNHPKTTAFNLDCPSNWLP